MHGVGLFLLQVAVVLLAARVLGRLARLVRQPQVVGEMAAGILLGPSLLGWLAPELSQTLFPPDSLGGLHALSQLGLILFMFLVGLELDPRLLRERGHLAVVISHASIVAPFLLGAGLALYLHGRHGDPQVSLAAFALFLGAAMSVTAFPVLARILTERNLLGTKVGALAIACAAVDDVTAWCILAGVVAFARSGALGGELLLVLLGAVLFVVVLLFLVRRGLRQLEARYHSRGRLTPDTLALILLCLFASAWTTESLGIHALFGAFLLGAVMPKDPGFVHELALRLEDVTVILLLPLFFAYTGLRTSIGLLDGPLLWLECLLVIAVAVLGKLGGSSLAARACGLTWREAGAIGVLMNTRGLMELVILSIGLDLGVITPVVFVMMVLMALVTTVMTTPLLEWIYPVEHFRREALDADERGEAPGVLIPVSLPASGPELLRVAHALVPAPRARLYALHLLRPGEERPLAAKAEVLPADQRALRPLLEEARELGIAVRPLVLASRDVAADIAAVMRAKALELVLLGLHRPVASEGALGGTVSRVMERAPGDVAVYLARARPPWLRVLVPLDPGAHGQAVLELALTLVRSGSLVTLLQQGAAPGAPPTAAHARPQRALERLLAEGARLERSEERDPLQALIRESAKGYELVLLGADGDEGGGLRPFGAGVERLAEACEASLLVLHRSARSRSNEPRGYDPRP